MGTQQNQKKNKRMVKKTVCECSEAKSNRISDQGVSTKRIPLSSQRVVEYPNAVQCKCLRKGAAGIIKDQI